MIKLRAVDGIKEVPGKENVVTRERQRLAAAENPKPTRRYVMDELLKYFEVTDLCNAHLRPCGKCGEYLKRFRFAFCSTD